MNQPINPNTNLPMSLRVERIQHLKQIQAAQEQNYINQEMETHNEQKQKRVNDNNSVDESKIKDKQQKNNSREKEDDEDSDEKEKKEEKLKIMKIETGRIIDIRV